MPPAVISSFVVDVDESVANVNAIEAPTAAFEPAADAVVDVVVEPVFDDDNVNEPPIDNAVGPDVPKLDVDVFRTIDNPTDGVTDTDPAEPIDAVVVVTSLFDDVNERLRTPISSTPSPTSDDVASVTIDNPTDAPTPTFPPVFVPLFVGVGVAVVVVVDASTAPSVTSPPPAETVAS